MDQREREKQNFRHAETKTDSERDRHVDRKLGRNKGIRRQTDDTDVD